MGWMNFIFGNNNKPKIKEDLNFYFKTFNGYSPVFTSQDGGVYELGLCRAAIHRKATESSKAKPVLTVPNKRIEYIVSKRPNQFMSASQFFYRLRTIYEVENNAFIIPIEDKTGAIVGLFPIVPSQATLKELNKKVYVVYDFPDGDRKSIEYSRIGHVRKMQYKNDFFGESNRAFKPTADLVRAQDKETVNAIKNGSNLRFMGKLNTTLVDKEDLKEQQKFVSEMNIQRNDSGVFVYDKRFEDMKQIIDRPVLLDEKQKAAIDNAVYNYWGVNEDFLQNKYKEDTWNAIYESEIESFFIQVGEVMSHMFYSESQMMNGTEILLTSDRLQYASNQTKIQVAKEYFDRGLITTNQALRILNMAPVPDGDKRFIRAEYIQADDIGKEVENDDNKEKPSAGKNDDIQSGNESDPEKD